MYALLSQLGTPAPGVSSDQQTLDFCFGPAGFDGSNPLVYGQNNIPCQVYLAQRCAQNWDAICENAYKDQSYITQTAQAMSSGNNPMVGLTPGDVFLRNTAQEKYRVSMRNCELKIQPFNYFDPSSPQIAYYVGPNCIAQYAVDPSTVDSDIVMHKVLDNPGPFVVMLRNIKNTMLANGSFMNLRGTRLGRFYGL